MPNFVTTAGEEVYRDSVRLVFRRGQRLDDDQIRRLRDIWFTMLCALGADSEDIARTAQLHVSARQVRYRVNKEVPLDFKRSMQEIAEIVLHEAKSNPRFRRSRPVKPRPSKSKRKASSRQLMLFDLASDEGAPHG